MAPQDEPYNPLSKANLSASVVKALLDRPVVPLAAIPRFNGAGLYLIYHTGENAPFPAYEPLARLGRLEKFERPIYAGKAVPAGGRRGTVDVDGMAGTSLWKRLTEHAESIQLVGNLDVRDFQVRHLVVDDTWIGHGEGLLLRHYAPLWNQCLDGFGNHDPGAGRYNQKRSPWDTLHPGRPWAFKCADNPKRIPELLAEIDAFMATLPPA